MEESQASGSSASRGSPGASSVRSLFRARAARLRHRPSTKIDSVGECGGTVTLQTKHSDGSLAQADVTYHVDHGTGVEQVTTSQISRAAAVDMKFPSGATQVTASIAPWDLHVAGYTATAWACSSRGAPLDSSQWSLKDAGDPSEGIQLTVNANEAISCTMTVT